MSRGLMQAHRGVDGIAPLLGPLARLLTEDAARAAAEAGGAEAECARGVARACRVVSTL